MQRFFLRIIHSSVYSLPLKFDDLTGMYNNVAGSNKCRYMKCQSLNVNLFHFLRLPIYQSKPVNAILFISFVNEINQDCFPLSEAYSDGKNSESCRVFWTLLEGEVDDNDDLRNTSINNIDNAEYNGLQHRNE